MRTVWKCLLILVCAACLAGSASAYTVSLTQPGYVDVEIADGLGGGHFENGPVPAFPYQDTISITDGTGSLISGFDLSDSGFTMTFDYARGAGFAGVTGGEFYFSVDENIRYTATGSLSAADPVGRVLELTVYLADVTYPAGLFLLKNRQTSDATPNESFTLGQAGGDYRNTNEGSLTGTLLAGVEYGLIIEFEAFYDHQYPLPEPPEYSDATFSGNVSLSFSAIPEPTTASLLALGLVGIAAVRRRRAN